MRTDEDILEYHKWARQHKSFRPMEAFFESLDRIKAHNKKEEETYRQGLTEYSGLKDNERDGGLRMPTRVKRVSGGGKTKVQRLVDLVANFKAPAAVNYTKGFPQIRNQGICLSCWAFTAVDIIEYKLLKRGKNISLSVQNLVDCSTLNYGCTGGWPTYSFLYMRDFGISNGTRYTYRGVKQECQRRDHRYKPVLKISDVCEVFLQGNEELMKKIIARYGPVSGAMATTENFTNYKSGVFYDIRCRNHTVDHAISIIGYGTHPTGGDYWIIRNSWGVSWGMQGYGLMARNKNNACGIALYAMLPC